MKKISLNKKGKYKKKSKQENEGWRKKGQENPK